MVNEVTTDEVLLATGGYDHTIRFWTAHNGTCQRIVQHPDSQVNALDMTPDRHMLAAAGFQHIRMYEINSTNPNPVVNYEGVSKNICAVGFHNEGRWMFSGGEDCSARIWDLRTRSLTSQRCHSVGAVVNCVTLHPNQSELYIGDQSGSIHIWDLQNDKPSEHVKVTVESDVSIQDISIDPDGNHLAAVDNKGNCYTFAIQRTGDSNLQRRIKLQAHKRYALKCKFSPDSTMLATSSADSSAKIWRSADVTTSLAEEDNVEKNKSGLHWNKIEKTISPVVELKDKTQRWVWDMAFSADSQFIITGSSDNHARLWNAITGDVKRVYSGHQKSITAIAFSDASV